MAMLLRRTISFRNLFLLRASLHSSNRISSSPTIYNSVTRSNTAPSIPLPPFDFLKDSRRWYAKGRKSKDTDESESVDVVPNIGPAAKETAKSQMETAIVALSQQLSKQRTGRASAGMLDHITIETGGMKMPLNRIALVSVMDSKTLSISPYDPNAVKEIENAIVSSPLGLNPKEDGQRLRVVIPPLTKERIQAVCKVITRCCEDIKQSIRRARQKSLDTVKKAGSSFPKDEAKRFEKEVDEMTKKFVKSAEDMCKAKEKEIMEG